MSWRRVGEPQGLNATPDNGPERKRSLGEVDLEAGHTVFSARGIKPTKPRPLSSE